MPFDLSDNQVVRCGPFELRELIGSGGMGAVYAARHVRDGTPVAVKLLDRGLSEDDQWEAAFRREVQALARLIHPSIATVYDFGTVAESQELVAGTPWYAMELIRGPDLSSAEIDWDWERLSTALINILDGLANAHANGVLHLDLKPSNVVAVDGEVDALKIVDFGTAWLYGDVSGASRGEARVVRGTPKYMAPERIRGAWSQQGPWTDLYALGCVAWRLASGEAMFLGNTTEEVLEKQVEERPRNFSPAFQVPFEFQGWIRRLVAKEPSRRFRRAADAAYALVRLAGSDDWTGPRATDISTTTSLNLDIQQELTLRAMRSEDGEADAELQAAKETVKNVLCPVSIPPLPDDWKRPAPLDDRRPDNLAGLELYGIRKVPLVDRDEQRDVLWRGLERTIRLDVPCGVLLRGPLGIGKSRLVEWLAERSHETGAATVLRVVHSETGGPRDGIGAALLRHFGCDGRSWSEIFSRLESRFAELRIDESARLHDALGLASLGARQDDEGYERGPRFKTPRERQHAYARVIHAVARRRPVILWLDDLQWGWETAKFAKFLLDGLRQNSFPVFVAMAVDDEPLGDHPEIARLISAIGQLESTETCTLDRLASEHHRALVDRLIRLDSEESERVARQTSGHPLFAVQLLEDWVQRGLLQPGDGGFELRDRSEAPAPDDLATLWKRRLRRLVNRLPESDARRAKRALDVAAALGPFVDDSEWIRACNECGFEPPAGLERMLTRQGLAVRREHGWSFVHPLIVESLVESAEVRGTREDVELACARALATFDGGTGPEFPERRARHFSRANRPERAVESLLEGARRAGAESNFPYVERLLAECSEILDRLDVPRTSRMWVRHGVVSARLAVGKGDFERARELSDEISNRAEDRGWQLEHGRVLLVSAVLSKIDGAFEEGLQELKVAERVFEQVGDDEGRARALLGEGEMLKRLNRFDEARKTFREARAIYEEREDHARIATIDSQLSYTFLAQDEYRRARDYVERALERTRRNNLKAAEALCYNNLGEVARFQGDWEEARRAYASAVEIESIIGSRMEHLARFNLILVEVESGRYRVAREKMEEALPEFYEAGYTAARPTIEIARACCAAAAEDWEQWDRAAEEVSRALSEHDGRYPADRGRLAEIAADLAEKKGEFQRAKWALEIARDAWSAVGNEERASAAGGSLRSLEARC